jgi:prepilin-type N-terminal cleavage/methylation domain-containing protein/prepilin-type processing-associated H-X9-DG protein
MKRRGFTLIELLVVIAIIAILAAILFPVFARARAKARQASCTSNVKQLMLGLIMYASDYDGIWLQGNNIPGHSSWANWTVDVFPYVKNIQIFRCPAANTGNWGTSCEHCTVTPQDLGTYYLACDYMYNRVRNPVSGANEGPWGVSEESFRSPAMLAALVDGRRSILHFYPWARALSGTDGRGCDPSLAGRHNDTCNVGYADGHAKTYQPPTTAPVAGTPQYDMWNRNS